MVLDTRSLIPSSEPSALLSFSQGCYRLRAITVLNIYLTSVSSSLCQMTTDDTKRLIHPLTGLIFNLSGCLAMGVVADPRITRLVICSFVVSATLLSLSYVIRKTRVLLISNYFLAYYPSDLVRRSSQRPILFQNLQFSISDKWFAYLN